MEMDGVHIMRVKRSITHHLSKRPLPIPPNKVTRLLRRFRGIVEHVTHHIKGITRKGEKKRKLK